jgi:hypothetical protein
VPLLALLLPAAGRADPILGQIDTFEDGTTQGWAVGSPSPPDPFPPVNVPNGGPAGAGDHYLQITSDAGRAGGRLTVFNRSQWAGNFLAAGVGAVEMDLKNFGTTPLSMRIALKSGVGIGSPGFASTNPFVLPADGQWHHAVFPIDEADLTRIGSTTLTLTDLLSNVAEFRILNSAAPALNGDRINTQVGVDNIQADAPLPEPSSLVLLGLGTAGLAGWRRWKRAKA